MTDGSDSPKASVKSALFLLAFVIAIAILAFTGVANGWEQLAAAMDRDLGRSEIGQGCRPLGRVKIPQPLIDHDGNIRSGFEPK